MTGHPSSLMIDGIASGHLTDAAASAHIAECARCRGDLEAAKDACAVFTREVFPRTVDNVQPRRPSWLPWVVPALAAAVLAIWFVRKPDDNQVVDEGSSIRRKGALSFQVFASRKDQVIAVQDSARLAPGDRIRFVVGSGGPAYLLVASIDGAGTATVYYPYAGMQSGPATAEPSELPGSIVLDAAPGPERVFALVSSEPIDAALVIRELRAIGERGADAIRAARTLSVPATAQATLVFEKAVPP
jgi:hypothetical protein